MLRYINFIHEYTNMKLRQSTDLELYNVKIIAERQHPAKNCEQMSTGEGQTARQRQAATGENNARKWWAKHRINKG